MQDPGSPRKIIRTCPRCSGPVVSGDKFCETCGTRIPELSTCSKCGTQFITPIKYCDLCGAPVILAVPETDDLPEHDGEEDTVQVEEPTPVRDEEEIPEPDELPEDIAEENSIPAEDETLRHYKREIVEPDTEELLEKFGKEYDVHETLESSRKSKSRLPAKQEATKPSRVPAQRDRLSSGTVDDALLLSPEKPEAKAKPPADRTRIIIGCIVLAAVIAAVYFIGLPMFTGSGGFGAFSNPPAAEITPVPTTARTITPALTVTPTPASKSLVPQPTQTVPTGQKLYFQVQKSPVTSRILVIFAGSAGHGSISSADVRVTHPDGSVSTGTILPLKGITEIVLEGSKETDRVEIIAFMTDGGTYRVYDELVSSMG
ncbi:MAG: zinc ribbon domain-containing protein [Methanoregula sp.]|nr:zinc ribbon domain-containing protein [Methanoregula sp.]